MVNRDWTLEQAAELCLEQTLELLDGCDDDDVVRPELVLKALRDVWAPNVELTLPEGLTARELRERVLNARASLAGGEQIP